MSLRPTIIGWTLPTPYKAVSHLVVVRDGYRMLACSRRAGALVSLDEPLLAATPRPRFQNVCRWCLASDAYGWSLEQ